MGFDEVCELDYPAANQPTCPHTLGDQSLLTSQPVYNIMYPSGEEVRATSGIPGEVADGGDEDVATSFRDGLGWWAVASTLLGTLLV